MFLVVLLTYEREQVLLAALARLNHLPYLNKIIVVWNGPTPPTADGVWPKTSAPVIVNVIFLSNFVEFPIYLCDSFLILCCETREK